MKIFRIAPFGAIGALAALLLLSGCVTYPYQTAFDACDAEAGACYRYCEDAALSDYEYGACHADCEAAANRCFASAYDRYSYDSAYGGSYYSPSWPWYGRYGAWGPSSGYYFDFSYWGGSGRYYDPYYKNRYRHDRRRHGGHDRDRDHDRDDKDGKSGDGAYAPPAGSPAADNPNRPRQTPRGQGERPYSTQSNDRTLRRSPPPAQNVAPPPSAPAQSSPPPQSPPQSSPAPAASPREQQPARSKPAQQRPKGSRSPRSNEQPQDY